MGLMRGASMLRQVARRLSSSASTPGGKAPSTVVGGQRVPFAPKKHNPDEPERLTCHQCGFIFYENPLVVTGSVATHADPKTGEELILLCRRAIAPRTGYWNLCAGYMEKGESLQDSAKREAWEEAYARLRGLSLLSIYDIKHIGQVHIYWSAKLTNGPQVGPGPESLEVRMFKFDDIPWDELAFPTVSWALMHYQQSRQQPGGAPYFNPVLRGHEGSTNVWWRPEQGLYYDDKWLSGQPPPTAEAP